MDNNSMRTAYCPTLSLIFLTEAMRSTHVSKILCITTRKIICQYIFVEAQGWQFMDESAFNIWSLDFSMKALKINFLGISLHFDFIPPHWCAATGFANGADRSKFKIMCNSWQLQEKKTVRPRFGEENRSMKSILSGFFFPYPLFCQYFSGYCS